MNKIGELKPADNIAKPFLIEKKGVFVKKDDAHKKIAGSEKLLNAYKVIFALACAALVVCIAAGIFQLGRAYGSARTWKVVYDRIAIEEKLSPERKKCLEQIFGPEATTSGFEKH